MAKFDIKTLKKLKRPTASTYRSWWFIVALGLLLAVFALFDRGGLGSTACRLEVVADVNLRAGPSQESGLVRTLRRGEQVDGTGRVTDGFRELKDSLWTSDTYLTPLQGADCA